MIPYKTIDISKGIYISKSKMNQIHVCFAVIGILKSLAMNMNNMFVMVAMIYQ